MIERMIYRVKTGKIEVKEYATLDKLIQDLESERSTP